MQNKELQDCSIRQAISMPESSPPEETEAHLKGLVEAAAEWAEDVCAHHGFENEAGGGRRIRGFLYWLWKYYPSSPSARPYQRQWASAPLTHLEGSCWCGFLQSTEERRLAEQGALPDIAEVLRLPHDGDAESPLPVEQSMPIHNDPNAKPCFCNTCDDCGNPLPCPKTPGSQCGPADWGVKVD